MLWSIDLWQEKHIFRVITKIKPKKNLILTIQEPHTDVMFSLRITKLDTLPANGIDDSL